VSGGRPEDLRSRALDAYLDERATVGYRVETRTPTQAIIVRRGRLTLVRGLLRAGTGDQRYVISVDEYGAVSATKAEPVRW
jgi:hypothetical protein